MRPETFGSHLVRYAVGFGAALCLSVAAYLLATGAPESTAGVMPILLILAIIQLALQLIFFLHMGITGRSYSRTVTLLFTLLMMIIVVVGSLWIMKNLDYRMGMSGEAMDEYMQAQNKKGF